MRIPSLLILSLILSLILLTACGEDTPAPIAAASQQLPESAWMAEVSGTPRGVIDLIAKGTDGESVLVDGRVGGTAVVFVEGRASFLIADLSLKDCYDMTDECQQPWDYCCEEPSNLQKGTVAVEFQSGGKPLAVDVRGFHGLDHGHDVTVRGTLRRSASGTIVLVADAVNVRPGRAK